MRSWRFRLSIFASVTLVLAAVLQSTAFGSEPEDWGAPRAGTSSEFAGVDQLAEERRQESERQELRRKMEEALAAFDPASLNLPEKPAHPRLDSNLNQIVEHSIGN